MLTQCALFCCGEFLWCQDGGDYCVPFQSPSDASAWLGAALVSCQISPHLEMRHLYFSVAVGPTISLSQEALAMQGYILSIYLAYFVKGDDSSFPSPLKTILEFQIYHGLTVYCYLFFSFSGPSLLVPRIFAAFLHCTHTVVLTAPRTLRIAREISTPG